MFKAIHGFILSVSIFYGISKISLDDFLEAIKQNPKLSFTTTKGNVKYTTLKDLRQKAGQVSIDEYSSLHSQYGLNCVRAYRHPELTYDYKKEANTRLSKTNQSW